MQQRLGRKSFALLIAPALAVAPMAVHASGFALLEQNASGLGNAYAGAAANPEDASTIYFNPAGLSYISGRQFVGGLSLIRPSAQFSDLGSQPSGTSAIPSTLRPLGGNGGDAGSLAYVPNLYLALDLAPNWKIGVGLNAPFGQKTHYDPDWAGRFMGVTSEIRTLNLNPTISYKASDTVSLGFGANLQRIDANFTSAVNYAAAAASTGGAPAAGAVVASGRSEGTAVLKGNDTAWGWNAGAMFNLTPQTHLGVAYRSEIRYRINGTASFSNIPVTVSPLINAGLNAQFGAGNIYSDVKLPASWSVALTHQLNDRWKILGDIAWTGWSSIQNLAFYRQGGTLLSSTPENFRDTWRVAIGATYRMNDQWSLRSGVAYDQTPVNSANITPRLPDNNRTWLSIGAQYRMSSAVKVDVGYSHLFMKDASINQNAGNAAFYGTLTGSYRESVDILGAQLAYSF